MNKLSAKYFLSVILIGFFYISSYCQNLYKINSNNACSFYCGYVDSNIYGYPSSVRANSIVNNILTKVGLKPNFTLLAGSVENASATFLNDGSKVIFYNEDFIRNINIVEKSDWPSVFILAHEIGHHLNAHKLENIESRPENELNADEFAGFVLYRLGANLKETSSALNNINPNGCISHPPRAARILAATHGWTKAEEDDKAKNKVVSRRVKDLEIQISSIKKSQNSIDVTLKFIAVGDRYGTGYALKANGSGGIADYWKFVPIANGKLIDNLGNEYHIGSISGMGYARESNDWTILRIGENSLANIEFPNNSSGKVIGNIFDFYLDIWILYADVNQKSAQMAYTINFKGIKISD